MTHWASSQLTITVKLISSFPDGEGIVRFFSYYQTKKAGDPYSIKPSDDWDVPVRWDDPMMLFIPTFTDKSILAAIRYIIDNGLENDAFENENEIRQNDLQ